MRKLSDHHADLGSGRKGSIFPEEVKVKHYADKSGAGRMMDYPDTIDKIDRDQSEAIRKAERNKQKDGYRN